MLLPFARTFAWCHYYRGMVPQDYTTFFATSTGASATLLGLLFVAIAVEPQSVFGGQAPAQRRAKAVSAFVALANVFFISLGALIPNIEFGGFVLVGGGVAILRTGGDLWRSQRERIGLRALLMVSGFVVYGLELFYGQHLLKASSDAAYLSDVALLVVGVYAIGLGNAWELLGGPPSGFLVKLITRIRRGDGRSQELGEAAAQPDEREPDKRSSS